MSDAARAYLDELDRLNEPQRLRVELDAALAKQERIRALHAPWEPTWTRGGPMCRHCSVTFPCATIRAMASAASSVPPVAAIPAPNQEKK